MVEVLKIGMICFTVAAVLLPIAFLIALSLPHASELRQMVMRVCYWGVALLSVAYFALPIDALPDVLFPVGYADDLIALGIGWMNVRKALRPSAAHLSRN